MPSQHSVFGDPPPPRRRDRDYGERAFPDGYGRDAHQGGDAAGAYRDPAPPATDHRGAAEAPRARSDGGKHRRAPDQPVPGRRPSGRGRRTEPGDAPPRRRRSGGNGAPATAGAPVPGTPARDDLPPYSAPGRGRPGDRTGAYADLGGETTYGSRGAGPPGAYAHPGHDQGDSYDDTYGDAYGDAYGDHDEDDDTPGRKGRRGWKQRLILAGLGSIVILCLLGVGIAAYAIHLYGRIERFTDLDLDVAIPGEPINYLIIGDDDRVDAGAAGGQDSVFGARSDSIVIFRVDPQSEQVVVLSIPRDLQVPLARDGEFDPDATPQQINHAYSQENGRDDLIQTIRENFDIRIHHYVEITLGGFERLIDSVGGVEMYFDEPIHDRSTGFTVHSAGCHNLNGETAALFVRSRNLHRLQDNQWVPMDPTADLGRTTRQQEFIQQAMSKALDEAPTNPNQLRQTVEALAGTIGLDDSIRISDLLDLVEQFRGLNPDDPESLLTLGLPIDSGEHTGFDVVLLEQEAEPIFNVFRGLDPGEIRPGLVTLTVLNGTGEEDQALNVAGAFQEIGFNIAGLGDREDGPEHTTIYHAPGDKQLALRVARHVTGGAWVVERADVPAGQVELVTGADFETIHEAPTPLDEMPDTDPPADVEDAGGQDGAAEGDAPTDDGAAPDDTEQAPAEENGDDSGDGDDAPVVPQAPTHGEAVSTGGTC